LLGNGIYSNSLSLFAQENEAEIEADIEQENKCKKDTECENENELNNKLNIVNQQNATQSEEPVLSECENCFINNLSEEQVSNFIIAFSLTSESQTPFQTLEQICQYIDENDGTESGQDQLDFALSNALTSAEVGLSFEEYQSIIQCLQEAGFNVEVIEN